jgi:hypothetical protein
MPSVFGPIKLRAAKGLAKSADRQIDPMQCCVASAKRPYRRSTHERNQTLHGSVGFDEVLAFHDEALEERWRSMSEGGGL